jgi:hypothetical protein
VDPAGLWKTRARIRLNSLRSEALEQCSGPLRHFHTGSVYRDWEIFGSDTVADSESLWKTQNCHMFNLLRSVALEQCSGSLRRFRSGSVGMKMMGGHYNKDA